MSLESVRLDLKVLKESGVGEITSDFLASCGDNPDEAFTLKRLLLKFSGEREFLKRYAAAARGLCAIQHRNIVYYFDVFDERGLCSILTEYIPGRDLRQILERCGDRGRDIPVPLQSTIMLGVARSLAYVNSISPEWIQGELSVGDILVSFDGEVKIKGLGGYQAVSALSSGLKEQILHQRGSDWEMLLRDYRDERFLSIVAFLAGHEDPDLPLSSIPRLISETAETFGWKLGRTAVNRYEDLLQILGELDPPSEIDVGASARFMRDLFASECQEEERFFAENGLRIRKPPLQEGPSEADEGRTLVQEDEEDRTLLVDEGKTVVVDAELGVPKVLGDCEVVEKLSDKGGMSTIYKAWNRKVGAHRVLKVLSQEQIRSVDYSIETFVNEARIEANLSHPNIVVVHTVGQDEGFHFIEMEFIDGYDLGEIGHEDPRIPFSISLLILDEVCKALDFAHNHRFYREKEEIKGVIHRDIKPENIMITRDGQVKLTDFGISKAIRVTDKTLSATGTISGTIPYMSPEQINDPRKVDCRSDIFSLGTVLYEMTTGQRPFPGETVYSVIGKISRGVYEAPRKINAEVPGEIESIIKKALQHDLGKRYPSIKEMQRDVRQALSVYTIEDAQETIRRYLKDRSDYPKGLPEKPRRPLGKVVAGILGVIVVAGVIWFRLEFLRKPEQTTVILSFNYPPTTVRWDGREVKENVGDPQNFTISGVTLGKHWLEAELLRSGQKVASVADSVVVDQLPDVLPVDFPLKP